MTRALVTAVAALATPLISQAQPTQRATGGDTIIARTTGKIPETAVRRLTLDWKASVEGGEIGDIGGMAVAPDGRIYIWDPATPSIWLLSADGKVLTRIGRKGGGPGEYARINGIAVLRNGNLVAWDEGNARVNFYDPDGKFLTSSLVPFPFCCPSNVVTADTLNRVWLYLIDGAIPGRSKGDPQAPRRSAFLVLDESGAIRDTVEAPPMQTEYAPLTAQNPNSISSRVMPYGGVPRHVASPFMHVVSGTGRPYVVHSTIGGRPLRIENASAPVAISRQERSQLRANLEAQMRQVQPDWRWSGPDIPAEKPPYFDLRVGQDGRIWVALSVASESYVPDAPANPSTPPVPPVGFRAKERRWDVYAPDGRFLARVAGPRTFTAHVMRGNVVWGVMRDADDLPTVVRMTFN